MAQWAVKKDWFLWVDNQLLYCSSTRNLTNELNGDFKTYRNYSKYKQLDY